MTVTNVETVGKSKYKIYVDEQFAFVLYKGELSHYKIAVNEEITADVYERIMKEVIAKRAKLRALHLLNAMGRTEEQLREKLRQGEYPDDIIEEAISYVKSFGYINDEEYARSFIAGRKEKKSRKELYIQLRQKGIDTSILDTVFDEYYDSEDSYKAIRSLLEKKRYSPENTTPAEKSKIMAYLVRKGFSYEDIRQVLQVSEWNA